MTHRLRAYRTSHWTVNVLRSYPVSEKSKKSLERQCFALLAEHGLEQKLEKFRLPNPTLLSEILSKLDVFM